jgi:mucin-19
MQADSSNRLIRAVNLTTGIVWTLAGRRGVVAYADGIGSNASFRSPWGVAVNGAGTFVLVSEISHNLIRAINVTSGIVTTLAGTYSVNGYADGVGTLAIFSDLFHISVNNAGTLALVVRTM